MKKTYIQPTALVVLIHGNRMLMSGSNIAGGGNASESISQDEEGDVKGISDINIWDDDDEW
ncbi:MAG: hypothetical protein IJS63_10530 [Bacteroidaceae bacterium]|nr:hypothetical protein [Bacteroidaceae bacterium]